MNLRDAEYISANLSRWKSMITRCYDQTTRNYNNYGGRGIRIHKEWQDDFWAYHNYIMSLPNAINMDSLSIDREDNDGNYEPGNVRWANSRQQFRNRRSPIEMAKTRVPRYESKWKKKYTESLEIINEQKEEIARLKYAVRNAKKSIMEFMDNLIVSEV